MSHSVSVIIVNYNGGPLLSECVRCALDSTVPVEVFVSDNASTDTSLIELRLALGGHPRLHILENPSNLGFARANNRALELSGHEFILFLNPDCILAPDTLARMLALFDADADVGMAGCLIRNPDGSEQPGCRRSIPTPWRTFVRLSGLGRLGDENPRFENYLHIGKPLPDEPVRVEAISGAFMLVRREALRRVGPMDEGYFMHFEDLDWCLRFKQGGWKILFEPRVEVMHVGGVCSASRPMAVEYHKHRGMARFYRKFFGENNQLSLYLLILPAIWLRFLLRIIRIPLGWLGVFKDRLPQQEAREVAEHMASPLAAPENTDSVRPRAVVTGATSLIGDYLLPGLLQAGYDVHAVSREPPDYGHHPHFHWHHADITQETPESTRHADVLIHLAPLATLPELLERLDGQAPRRVIGFGSTSMFTKAESALEKERELVAGLNRAEREIAEMGKRYGFRWTVFRPTLVYHLGRDKNVTTIAHFLKRFGFFPIVGEGVGLRQPVHAEDLANAALRAIDNPRSFDKAYNLSGRETLSYREMVRRIAEAIGIRLRMVNIPLPVFRGGISILSRFPRFQHLNSEMVTRISQDMCFDNGVAVTELGFSPRPFLGDTPAQG